MPAALRLPLLALLLLWSTVACARGPLDTNLHEATGRDDLLYIVLFSLPDCPYCIAIRDAYLPALPDDPRFRERVRIREIGIGSPRLSTDFNGEKISHADVARRYKVKFAPTVLFLDSKGQAKAAPLLGGDSVGLYGGYLEKRVLQGLGLLAPD
jgi:thioredoxin-related protein